ncbi:beta strand repeat-containing protein [Ferruginibacter albus]|uniref:beta strand repeat-containing protein n=1 Tax=Ferruginibacter albus TaxID=2875540 RepID=UPI001CC6D1F9|nr:sugar-binding protein [Ferruginibacter albus]UAY51206.1 fibronectin type III domain-containing protein [Ferruginibacter albus]
MNRNLRCYAADPVGAHSNLLSRNTMIMNNDLLAVKNGISKKIILLGVILFTFSAGFAQRFAVASGNWDATSTWSTTAGGSSGASVPTASDNVTIPGNFTVAVRTSSGNATCNSLTIQSGGTLTMGESGNTTARTLVVSGNIQVNTGGTFTCQGNNAVTHNLNVAGDFTNNGTVNFVVSSNRLVNVTFNKSGTQTLSGTPTSNVFNGITIGSGTTVNCTSDLTLNGVLTNNATGTSIFNATAGTITLASTAWSVTNNASGIFNTSLNLNNATVTGTGTNKNTLKFIFAVSGTLTINSGVTFDCVGSNDSTSTGNIILNKNGAGINNLNTSASTTILGRLTVLCPNATDVVSLSGYGYTNPINIGGSNQRGALYLTKGILKLTSNYISFPKYTYVYKTSGDLASSGDGAGVGDVDADGGTIFYNPNSGSDINLKGGPTLNNFISLSTDGNGPINFGNVGNARFNGIFSIINGNSAAITYTSGSAASNGPKWGPNSTLYYKGDANTTHTTSVVGSLWFATSGTTIGSTIGYPNNVTFINAGGPYTISQSVPLNGVLTCGDGSTASSITISGGTAPFTCGGLNIQTSSTLIAPSGNMIVKGDFTNFNTFTNSGGTVTFGGSSQQNIGIAAVTTNITTVNGSPFATVASASGLVVGEGNPTAVTGIAANTRILAINGTTIYLSANATASGTVSITFSKTNGTHAFNNLTISNTAYVKLKTPTSVAGVLALPTSGSSGIIETDNTNLLSVTNTGTGAITGGYTSGYINGPVKWTSNTTNGAQYAFPVGSGTTNYLPLVLTKNTTTATNVTISASTGTFSSATFNAPLDSLSKTEHWRLIADQVLTGSTVSLNRTAAMGNLNKIGESTDTTGSGSYSSIGGTGTGPIISGDIGSGKVLDFQLAKITPCAGPTTGTITASAAANSCNGGSLVTLSAPSLADGTYDITYTVTGTNSVGSTSVTSLVFSSHSASFTTSNLTSAGSANVVNITGIALHSTPTCITTLSVASPSFSTNQGPTVAGITAAATSVCAGTGSVVTVSGSTLADGAYTISYNVSGTNTVSSTTATMTVSGGTKSGTFTTSALSVAGAANVVNITGIALTASSACITTVSASSASFTTNSGPSVNSTTSITPLMAYDFTGYTGGSATSPSTGSIGSNNIIPNSTGLTATTDRFGTSNAAVSSFSASTNYMWSNAAFSSSPTTFSISGWFKTSVGGFMMGILAGQSGDPGSHDHNIWMDDNGHVVFGIWTGSATVVASPGTYKDNAWHHVVATIGTGNVLRLYMDGSLVSTYTATSSGDGISGRWLRIGYNTNLWIGGYTSGSGGSFAGSSLSGPTNKFWSGSVDGVNVYGSELSQSDVTILYTSGIPAISAATACVGSGSTVTVSSSALTTGTYTVTYNVSGTNTVSSTTASMSFTAGSPGTGTFTTSNLSTAGSSNVVNVTAISNASGCSTSVVPTASSANFTTSAVSATPTINSPINANVAATITGTNTDANSATIQVFKNGTTSLGTTSTVATGGTWTLSNANVSTGDIITAVATATGKCASAASSSVTVQAPVAGPPTVVTTAATSIDSTHATLNANVGANGFDVNGVSFDYGTTTGYGTNVNGTTSPATITTNGTSAATISGLTPNTLYHYRGNASNSSGTTNSTTDITFVTLPDAPVVGSPSSATATGFTANWTAPSPAGNQTYTYTVEASTSNTFSSIAATQSSIASGTLTYTFSTLSGATTYYYRVKAVNATGSSVASATSSAVTTTFTASTTPCSTSGTGASGSPAIIADAPYGGPTIDGTEDAIWSKTPAYSVNRWISDGSSSNIQAGTTWQAMYDSTNFYLLVKVKDANPRTTTNGCSDGNNWQFDAVEVYLAVSGNSTSHQTRFNLGCGGGAVSGTNTWTSGVVWAIPQVTGGYNLELKIPWATIGQSTPTSGTIVRFDLNIDDNQNPTTQGRTVQYAWSPTAAGDEYQSPGEYGYVQLGVCPSPTLSTPTVANITDVSADLGSTVTAVNGGFLSAGASGTVYRTTTGVTTENALGGITPTQGTPFTQTRTGLSPQTQYFYKAFATRNNFGVSLTGTSSEGSFYTLSTSPTTLPSFTSATGCAKAILNWNAATFPASGATTKGYVLLRAVSPTVPSLSNADGAPLVAGTGTTIIDSTITSAATTNGPGGDATVTAGNTYNYVLVPFTWDGTHAATRNYLTGMTAQSVTISATSVGGTAATTTSAICAGSTATLTLSNNTGAIQWQQSSDNSTWTNVTGGSGATTSSYTTAALTAGLYYRAAVTSGSCSVANSNSVLITVSQSSTASGIDWTSGTNDNTTGLGPWVLNSGATSGFFTASVASAGSPFASPFIDQASNSWGIYAYNGDVASASRSLTSFATGNSITFSMQNGYVTSGGTNAVGFSLWNASSASLMEFYYNGGYIINDASGANATTGISDSHTGLTVTIAYTASNSYAISVTAQGSSTVLFHKTGTFISTGNQTPASVRFFNGNSGSCGGGNCNNIYLNSLSLNNPIIYVQPSTAAQPICVSTTGALSVSAAGTNLSYQWYSNTTASNVGGSSVGGATSPSYAPPSPTPGTTVYYYCVVSGNCSATTTSDVSGAITSLATPATPGTITGAAIQCSGTTNQTYSISSVTDASTYTWTVPTGWSIQTGQGSASITVTAGTFGQNGNITVTAGNTCGTSSAQSTAVSVANPSVAPTGLNVTSASICSGTTSTLTQTGGSLGTGAYWQWYTDAGFTTPIGTSLTSSDASLQVTPASTTTYYLRSEGNTGTCANNVAAAGSVTITVTPHPVANIGSGDASICSSGNYPFTATASDYSAFVWTTTGDGAFADNNTLSATYTPAGRDFAIGKDTISLIAVALSGICPNDTSSMVLSINAAEWTGLGGSGDWNDPSNWSACGTPDATANANIVIPNNDGDNYPVLPSFGGTFNNVTLGSRATIDIGTFFPPSFNNTLTINGNLTGDGSIIGNTTATLVLGGTASNLKFTSGSEILLSLQLKTGATATLASLLNIDAGYDNAHPGTLSVDTNAVFNTGDGLTLVSNDFNTAQVTPVGPSGAINGRVTLQRFLRSSDNDPYVDPNGNIYIDPQAKRAWRLLTAPFKNTDVQTIYQSWQENGLVYEDGDASTHGKGTLITGPGGSNGLEPGVNSNYSMKVFNYSTQKLENVANTNVAISQGSNGGSAENTGYFIFIRGDRNPETVRNPNGGGVPVNVTTLSAKGVLQTGPQVFPLIASGGITSQKYTLVGNPYASPIDLNKVSFSGYGLGNIDVYTWDPSIGDVGAYVLLENENQGAGFQTNAQGHQNSYIQSSQAFFVLGSTNSPSLTIDEDAKVGATDNNNNLVFRPTGVPLNPWMIARLYNVNNDNSVNSIDYNQTYFNNAYSMDAVLGEDAPKLANIGETFSVIRGGTSLFSDRRPVLRSMDTVFFKLLRTKTQQKYQLRFFDSIPGTNLEAWLKDNYTKDSMLISLTDSSSIYSFTSAGVDGSGANLDSVRFTILFRPQGVNPVTFTNVKAQWMGNSNVSVQWNVANQLNINKYEVERSTDGKTFTAVGDVNAVNGTLVYNLMDDNAAAGTIKYRIKSISTNGEVLYSQIVTATIEASAPAVTIITNPVVGSTIELKFNNMPTGKYVLRLMDNLGRTILSKEISHSIASPTETLPIYQVAKGVYHLDVFGTGNYQNSIKVIR